MTRKPTLNHQQVQHHHSQPANKPQVHASEAPTALNGLQRSVGNANVQHLLRSPDAPQTIQRTPAATQEETYGYVTVPDLRTGNLLLGPRLRGDMRAVVQQSKSIQVKRGELDGMIEFLKIAAETNGPADVQALKAIEPTTRKLTGRRRVAFEGGVDRYRTSMNNLQTMMLEVEAARKDIVESSKMLESQVLAQKKITTQRDKEDQEGKLADLQAKRDKANAIISGFIDFSKLLINPAEGWGSALKAAAGLVGNKIQDMALGGSYAQQIAAVRENISGLTDKIKGIEDAQALSNIESATAKLQGAQIRLEARLNELDGAVAQTEVAQDDLQEILRGFGKKGAQAASVFSAANVVTEHSNDAIEQSLAHQQALEALKEKIASTTDQASYYIDILEMGNNNLSREQRGWAHDAAITNIRAARSWDTWVNQQLEQLKRDQAFLMQRSFQESYDEGIDDALKDMRLNIRPHVEVL
jgi:predicted  nucleic acid-binding Zn-ribbon protein